MAVRIGMRGKDLQKFLMVARDHNVIILVRHTNADSLGYIGAPGFYPKPAAVKAKTADIDPPATTRLVGGAKTRSSYQVAGLVVHPGFQPGCYRGAKMGKAQDAWLHTMGTLSPSLSDYDLKDVIVLGRETDHRRGAGKIDGVKKFTPVLSDKESEISRE
jgi:hypothetical protein